MAISRKPLDVDNYSALDGGNGTEIPGSYRRTNINDIINNFMISYICLLYTSPSPRDRTRSRMPSSA